MTDVHDRSARPARRRRAVALLTVLVLVAGAIGAATLLRSDDTATIETGSVATAEVTRSDLALSDRLDGTVERTDELVVVHRISGVAPGSNNDTAPPDQGGAADDATVIGVSFLTGGEPTASTSTSTSTSTETTSTTAPSTTDPSTTEPGTCPVGSTTTAPDPLTTSTTSPTTTAHDGDCATTTTSPSTTTTPTTSDPSAPPGGGPSSTPTPSDPTGGPIGNPSGGPSAGGALPSGGASNGPTGGSSTSGGTTQEPAPEETVTSATAQGSEVRSGDVLYSVDGRPVVALTGQVAAWRDLDTDADDGVDVLQLETALAALGYGDGGELTVDGTYDADTAAAVADWQEGLGVEATGEVVLGSIVFLPETATVTAVDVGVGDSISDGDPVLRLSTPEQQVTTTVPEDLQPVVTAGLEVEVAGVSGVVTRLTSSTDDEGTVNVVAHIGLAESVDADDGEEVTARFTITDASDVLLVPVDAVTSTVDGGYVVRLFDQPDPSSRDDGRWVSIETHGVRDGQVAVTGDGIDEGAVVGLPG